MTFAIVNTAIVVGIIAYGVGKLSVYIEQDNERDSALPEDPVQTQAVIREDEHSHASHEIRRP